ncbi:MAG: Asymmetrical Bis(5'-nucleosyl)-tetraphosphatase [Parcubacteria group bacterium GW2011_GWA2_47_16]|nr:MAG: Asymmetrical Bis(5'-nucleosyl)-tetraphosphatase [Parcubacteria group bacterium GW2011_GWA2_47_16]
MTDRNMIFFSKPKNFKSKFDVVSCFLEYEGKILLLHRQDHKPQGDTWGVPAGKIDAGETRLKAIVRELKEETAHLVTEEKSLLYSGKIYVRFPTYDFVYHTFHLPVKHEPKIVINPEEHKGFDWVSPAAALEMDLMPDTGNCIKLFYKLP